MLIIDFIRWNIFQSEDGKYLFSNCCFEFGSDIIGDYEQISLLKTLILSVEDLLLRMVSNTIVCSDSDSVFTIFESHSNDLAKMAIPINVESFDGDIGLMLTINGANFLVVKKWNDTSLTFIKINRKEYVRNIEIFLDYLNKINI